jgi:hypothetical protein
MDLCFPGHPARWITVTVSNPGKTTRETRAAAEAQVADMSAQDLEDLYSRSRPGPPFTQEVDLGVVREVRAKTAAASYLGPLHCPACSAQLARGLVTLPNTASCPGCNRRVAARRDGRRLVVEVELE